MPRLTPTIWLALILLGLGLATRLVALDYPREVIFDEVHFGKFISAYCCTHQNFFDIHPPHGKLLIAAAAYLGGYDGAFSFDSIGAAYPPATPLIALRIIPALAGALLPLTIFLLLRQLHVSPLLAFVGGWVLLFDNALTVHSRLIALDSMLLLATFGSLVAYLAGEHALTRRGAGAWWWFILAGGLAGLALGTKFTGLTALALLAVIIAVRCLQVVVGHPNSQMRSPVVKREAFLLLGSNAKPRSETRSISTTGVKSQMLYRWLLASCIIVLSAAAVYGAGWALHFALLTNPGTGDAFHQAKWSGAWPSDVVRETIALHRVMFNANYDLTATHPYASQWYTWPFMQRAIFYWQGNDRAIYFLGNPFIWWGIFILFLTALFNSAIAFGRNRQKRSPVVTRAASLLPGSNAKPGRSSRSVSTTGGQMLLVPLAGYLIAFVPFMRIPRALFLYHYLTPLIFSLIVGLVWLSSLAPCQSHPPAGGVKCYRVAIAAAALAAVLFVYFSPLTYGFHVPDTWHNSLFWLTTWR